MQVIWSDFKSNDNEIIGSTKNEDNIDLVAFIVSLYSSPKVVSSI